MSPTLSYPEAPTPEQLIAAIRQLSPTARVLARLQHLLADPNSGLEDISGLLKLDPSLVTRVIHVSNSIIFRRGDACTTIEEAVNRIGFREIFRLVAVVASTALSSGPLMAYSLNAEDVWNQAVGNAIAAEIIADRLGEDYSIAYTAGLLQTIGRTPINQFALHKSADRRLTDTGYPADYSGAEIALLGYNQAKVSTLMLQKWEFPPSLIRPVQYQYEPLNAPEPHDRLASIIFAGRLTCSMLLKGIEIPTALDEDEILANLRLNRNELTEMLPRLDAHMERARQITAASTAKVSR